MTTNEITVPIAPEIKAQLELRKSEPVRIWIEDGQLMCESVLKEPLDIEKYERAIDALGQAEDALESCLAWIEGNGKALVQIEAEKVLDRIRQELK